MNQLIVSSPIPKSFSFGPSEELYAPKPGFRVLTTLSDYLEKLDIPEGLREELSNLVAARVDYLSLTPGSNFPKESKQFEGRGIYLGGNTYVKGCGSVEVACRSHPFIGESRRFSGIPAFSFGDEPFFDPDNGRAFRRVYGALSLEGAHTEFVVAAAKLSTLIKDKQIDSLDQLLTYQIPIPIGVAVNRVISDGIKEAIRDHFHLQQEEKDLSDEEVARLVETNSHRDYGIVGLYVPTTERVSRSPYIQEAQLDDLDALQQMYFAFGDAVRFDLRLGWCFDARGAHLQNVVKLPSPFVGGRSVDFSDQFPVRLAALQLMKDSEFELTAERLNLECSYELSMQVLLISALSTCLTEPMLRSSATLNKLEPAYKGCFKGFVNGLLGKANDDPLGEKFAERLAAPMEIKYSAPSNWWSGDQSTPRLVDPKFVALFTLAQHASETVLRKDPYFAQLQEETKLLGDGETFPLAAIAEGAIEGYNVEIFTRMPQYRTLPFAQPTQEKRDGEEVWQGPLARLFADSPLAKIGKNSFTDFVTARELLVELGFSEGELPLDPNSRSYRLINEDLRYIAQEPQLIVMYASILRSFLTEDFLCRPGDEELWTQVLNESDENIFDGQSSYSPDDPEGGPSCPSCSVLALMTKFFQRSAMKEMNRAIPHELLPESEEDQNLFQVLADILTNYQSDAAARDEHDVDEISREGETCLITEEVVAEVLEEELLLHTDPDAYSPDPFLHVQYFTLVPLYQLLIHKFAREDPEVISNYLVFCDNVQISNDPLHSSHLDRHMSLIPWRWTELLTLVDDHFSDSQEVGKEELHDMAQMLLEEIGEFSRLLLPTIHMRKYLERSTS